MIIGSPSRALLDSDAPFALLLFSERKIYKKVDNSIDPRISGTDIDLVSADGAIGRVFEALNHAMMAESVFTIPGYGLLCCNKIMSNNMCSLNGKWYRILYLDENFFANGAL